MHRITGPLSRIKAEQLVNTILYISVYIILFMGFYSRWLRSVDKLECSGPRSSGISGVYCIKLVRVTIFNRKTTTIDLYEHVQFQTIITCISLTDVTNRITRKMNDGLVHFTIRTLVISSDLANRTNFTIVRFTKTTVSPTGVLHNTHTHTYIYKHDITIILIKYSFVSKTHTAGITSWIYIVRRTCTFWIIDIMRRMQIAK